MASLSVCALQRPTCDLHCAPGASFFNSAGRLVERPSKGNSCRTTSRVLEKVSARRFPIGHASERAKSEDYKTDYFCTCSRRLQGIAFVPLRKDTQLQGSVRGHSSPSGDNAILSTEEGTQAGTQATPTEVEKTVELAEKKARVAVAAASAAGFAVEVAEQQGAPPEASTAVGKAADAVGQVALKAAKAVQNVKENVEKSTGWALSAQEETIQRELERERNRVAQKEADEALKKQCNMDKGRKEMREWWLAKWDAKKRSEGWGEYEKCWVLQPADGSAVQESFVLSGDGVLVGAAPVPSGSIKAAVVDLPMVSSIHAKVYGKDVVKGRKLAREYFVTDLGSSNGTYLNKSKLQPKAAVKLSVGDRLRFGDAGATFELKLQS